MFLERFGYKSALYLSALIAAVHGSFYAYLIMHPSRYLDGGGIYVAAALTIFLGLWLSSQVARHAGTIFYFFSAGAVAVPLLLTSKRLTMSIGLLWAIAMGALSLANALIMLLSSSFALEFKTEREKRPAYKKHLLKGLMIVIIVLLVAATLIDIESFVNSATR